MNLSGDAGADSKRSSGMSFLTRTLMMVTLLTVRGTVAGSTETGRRTTNSAWPGTIN